MKRPLRLPLRVSSVPQATKCDAAKDPTKVHDIIARTSAYLKINGSRRGKLVAVNDLFTVRSA